jgi:prephenate dehydrogenase
MSDKLPNLRCVTIIGVGLLGASIGLAIKARWPKVHVAGVGRRKESLQEAMRLGAIDSAHLQSSEPAAASDMIILATPVGAFASHLQAIAGTLQRGAIVTDVGSTKAGVVRIARRILGKSAPFVGSHPMAGSEQRGPSHARADLLVGATCILTPVRDTSPVALNRVERFWRALGARTVRMSPQAHDRAVAAVSHLPHALAALLTTLPRKADLEVAAGGFADSTRMAGGDVEMWRDIFLTNRRWVLAAIDAFDENLMRLRDLVETGDAKGIERFLSAAKTRREAWGARRNNALPHRAKPL